MRIEQTPLATNDRAHELCERPRLIWLLCVALAWMFQVTTVGAVDIAEHKWGFNGKVAPHRFNVLSVLVNNPTPQPFSGDLELKKSLGAGFIDAPLVENVTLSPHASKWIQFYPYIASENSYSGSLNENWHLSYPGGGMDLSVPRLAKYQRVILDDPNAVTARGGAVKFHLPDNLFPPFVTATDALQMAVLDHVPRWEESRRQAFLDWLYLGGTVVILHDASGKFPEFKEALSLLKSPLDEQPHGAGRIVRLPMNRSQFTEDEYRQVCAGLPKNYYNAQSSEKTDDIIDRIDESQAVNAAQNYNNNNYNEGADAFKANSFLSQLKQMTKPEHNWLLLHFMFWVYIALIFPGCYLLGKKWSDFRIVYAGLLGTVTLFSIAFSYVGARGYGEATAVHTVAIAKPLPDGQLDVASWSNIFVTSGANYYVRHNAWGALYSTCNEVERVNGRINNGAEAVFVVDIPPYSNRELATRAKIPFAGPKLTVESAKLQDNRLTAVELDVQGLKQDDCLKVEALVGNSFYLLNWREGKLVLANEIGSVVGTLRVQEHRNNYGYGYRYGYDDGSQTTQAERYTQMFDVLLSRGLNVGREKDAEMLFLPKNMMRVFLYANLPPEFGIQEKNGRLTNQSGRVMYCINVTLPTDSTP